MSAAIWTASRFEPLVYWTMLCPSSRGGTKPAEAVGNCKATARDGTQLVAVDEDDGAVTDEKEGAVLEGPDDNEVTDEKEDAEILEVPEANDDTKLDFEDTVLQIGTPLTSAGPSFRGGGSCCLGVGVAI